MVSSNFTKKWMNKFVFTTTTNSFVRFLGEFKDTKKYFGNYLTFSRLSENNEKFSGKRHLGVQLAKMIPAPQVATIFFQSRWFIQIFHLRKFKYEIYRLFCPFYLTELYLYYFIIRCTYVGGWVFPFIWPYNLKNLTHRKKDALVKL